jgi:hypothetical protein
MCCTYLNKVSLLELISSYGGDGTESKQSGIGGTTDCCVKPDGFNDVVMQANC